MINCANFFDIVTWEQRKLKDLFKEQITNGIINNPGKNELNVKDINVINLYNGDSINIKDLNYINVSESKLKKYQVRKGDIFLTRSSLKKEGIAKSNILMADSGNYVFDDHVMRLRFSNKVIPYFMNQLLFTSKVRAQFISKAKTGSMTTIGHNDINKTIVNLPTSTSEQKSVATILRNINHLIYLQQQKNADIINLKKAILDKIFSNSNIQKWRDIRLNKVLSIPVDEPKEVTNIDDIISVKLNTQGISKIPNRFTLKLGSTKYYVRHGGQFIFGKQNFFNGSMAIIPSKYDGKVSSKDVPSLNINKDIVMPYFLWLYLSRPSFYKKTERWATGTGSKRLHIKDLLSLKIYIPNKNEQLRICKLMQSLDTQILKSQKHLKELQSIKKFLLQNMFI